MTPVLILALSAHWAVRRRRVRNLAAELVFNERGIMLIAFAFLTIAIVKWQVRYQLKRLGPLLERVRDAVDVLLIGYAFVVYTAKLIAWDIRRRMRRN